MSIEELKDLPVSGIAADSSVLFMWATFPLYPQAVEVIESWGFEYKTAAFIWVKRNKKANTWFWGGGNYTRSNPEPCILAIRGSILPRMSRSVHSIIEAPIEVHSKKPDETRGRIVELFGDLPRIELFARQTAVGWDSVGNSIE